MNYDYVSLMSNPAFLAVLIILVLWGIFWKGIALWNAARRNDTKWFIVLLVVNTLGLLEIVYLASRKKDNPIKRIGKNLKKRFRGL